MIGREEREDVERRNDKLIKGFLTLKKGIGVRRVDKTVKGIKNKEMYVRQNISQ